jgi:uncharacterized protein (TIGR02001 family)
MRSLCLALLLWATPAGAAELSGDIGIVTDYRFRGVSLSEGRPAVQGSVVLEGKSGLYGQLWASSLGHRADGELDLTGGYETDLSNHVSLDVSGTWYDYPSGSDENYVEGTAAATVARGAASARFGVSYVPPRRASGANVYAFVEGTYGIPKSPICVKAALGRERGAFDAVEQGGKWDWSLGGEAKVASARVGLAYVGSNADGGDRHAVVASALWEW